MCYSKQAYLLHKFTATLTKGTVFHWWIQSNRLSSVCNYHFHIVTFLSQLSKT